MRSFLFAATVLTLLCASAQAEDFPKVVMSGTDIDKFSCSGGFQPGLDLSPVSVLAAEGTPIEAFHPYQEEKGDRWEVGMAYRLVGETTDRRADSQHGSVVVVLTCRKPLVTAN